LSETHDRAAPANSQARAFPGEEQVAAWQRLEAQLERYRAAFQHARDIIVFVDPGDGRILEANEAAAGAYGYSREELLSLTIQDLRAPQTLPQAARQMEQAAAEGTLFETVHRRKDGSTFPVEVGSQRTPWDGRSVLLSIIRDITGRKRAEAKHERLLAEAEERRRLFEMVIENVPAGVVVLSWPDLVYEVANPAYRTSVPGKEVLGRTLRQVFPEIADQIEALMRQVMTTGQPYRAVDRPFPIRRVPDGPLEEAYFTFSYLPIRTPEGRDAVLVLAIETTEDVRAHKRVQELAEAAERRAKELDAVFQAVTEAILVWDVHGTVLRANPAGAALYGFDPVGLKREELIQRLQMRHSDGRPLAVEELPVSRVLRGEKVREERLALTDAQGREVQVLAAGAPLTGDDTPRGAVVVWHDVTAQEQLLAEVQHRAAQLDATLNAFAVGYMITDVAGRVIHMNPAAESLLGYGEAQRKLPVEERARLLRTEMADGKPFPADELPECLALRGRTVHGVIMVLHRPENRTVWVSAGAAPIRLPDGGLLGAVLSLTDVTALHDLQAEREQLLAAERRARENAEAALRLRDQFLSVAAHELKTPITNLRGYAELTLRRIHSSRITDPQEIQRAFETIDRQAERLSILANQMLDVSRLETGELHLKCQATDLVSLARRVVEAMQVGAARHMLALHAPPSLPANVDAARLEQVLYNLVDNAIRYSPQGGPVEVEVSAPDPDTVRVAVRDYGIGIPPEQRARLFTRFFKAGTRRPTGGLGLGLYYSQQIVELHGGRITAEFPEDGGSRFIVTLPRDLGQSGGEQE
jgi:two-component system, OmpR family, phosphate regulon sensor histidine kinase PhoR